MSKQQGIQNFKLVLQGARLSQSWAAWQLDVSKVYFNNVVRGEATPSDNLCERMFDLAARIRQAGFVKGGIA